jgi:hypothetical protein
MSRQATDQLYIELDYYYPEEYYVYQAEAAAAVIATATVSCDAGLIKSSAVSLTSSASLSSISGNVQQGEAALNSTVSQTVSAQRITDTAVALTASVTQSVFAAKNAELILVAFAAGSLTASAQRQRDAELAATGAWTIAVDYIRQRDTGYDETAAFTQSVAYLRSRDFESTVQAAFSLAADADKVSEVSASLDTSFSLSTNSQANYSAIIDISSNYSIVANGGISYLSSASLNFISSLRTSRYFGFRPRNLTISSFSNSNYQFGSYSYRPLSSQTFPYRFNLNSHSQDDWVLEGWFRQDFVSNSITNTLTLNVGGLRIGIQKPGGSSLYQALAQLVLNDGSSFVETANKSGYSTFKHLAVVKTGSTISWYFDGSRYATTTAPESWYSGSTVAVTNFRVSASGNVWLDEVSFVIGNTYNFNANNTSITVPATVRDNLPLYTQFLYHFDNNGLDDIDPSFITQIASATLNSNFALTGIISGPVRASASLTSSFNVVAGAVRVKQITLTAFSDAATSATALRTKQLASSITAQATVSATALRTKQLASTQSSAFALTADADLQQGFSADLTADFATTATALRTKQLAAAANTAATVTVQGKLDRPLAADLSSAATADFNAVKTTVADIDVIALFSPSITVFASRAGDVDLYSSASLSVSATRTRDTEIALSSAMQLDVDYTRIKELDATVNSSFTVEATPSGKISFIVSLSSEFTQTQTVDLVKAFDADLSSSFSTTIQTFDSLFLVGASLQSASATLTAVSSRQRDVSISTEAIATQLTVAAKVGEVVCDISSAATMSVDGNLIAGGQTSMTSAATVDAIPSKLLASAISIQNSAFALSSEPFVGVVGNSTISSSFSSAVEGVKITDTSATIAGEFLLSTSGSIQRGAAILTQSFGTLTATPLRIRTSEVDFEAIATELVAGTKIIRTSATLTATTTLTAVGRDLIIDSIVYKIPTEVWTWKIREETRTYTIQGD